MASSRLLPLTGGEFLDHSSLKEFEFTQNRVSVSTFLRKTSKTDPKQSETVSSDNVLSVRNFTGGIPNRKAVGKRSVPMFPEPCPFRSHKKCTDRCAKRCSRNGVVRTAVRAQGGTSEGRTSADNDKEVYGQDSRESWGFVKAKLAVFVSGGGSNFRALHNSILEGSIYGQIAVVVSDKPDCGGCEYAREHNIPVFTFPRGKWAPDGMSSEELVEALRQLGVEYVVLAGYLKLLPEELVTSYPRAILNIHPALLPAFGGKGYFGIKVHEAVVKSGARVSGPTVHFVDEKYDHGPIVAQEVVPVFPFDTPKDVQKRVLAEEHKIYSVVVAALCEGRISWREDGVPLIRKSWDDCEYL